MQKQFEKLREYLDMPEDLPFAEFTKYNTEVLNELQANYHTYDLDTLMKTISVITVVAANAIDRGKTAVNHTEKKKYKKIADKMTFWAEAVARRLEREYNMTKEQVDAEIDKLLADVGEDK